MHEDTSGCLQSKHLLRAEVALTRFLRTSCSQVSKISKAGDWMASQSNLIKCLSLLRIQLLSSHLDGISTASVYALFPPNSSEGSGSVPSKTTHRLQCAVRCPCICLFPRLNKSWSIRLTFARPNNLSGPPWNSPQPINVFPALGSQTWLHHSGYKLMITEKSEINHFPLSAVSTPAATAQDAVSLHHCQGTTLAQIQPPCSAETSALWQEEIEALIYGLCQFQIHSVSARFCVLICTLSSQTLPLYCLLHWNSVMSFKFS